MEIVKVNSLNPSRRVINQALEVLKNGGVVMFPTETVYGLGANLKNDLAVKKLYKIKGRKFRKPLPVLVSNIEQIKKVAKINKLGSQLIKKFLPGPLTIVFYKKKIVSDLVTSKKNTVAVRYPKHKVALKIASLFPLASSSANISGKPPVYSVNQFLKQFKSKDVLPDLILDAGRISKVLPSTIIDVSNISDKKNIKILRRGVVLKKKLF